MSGGLKDKRLFARFFSVSIFGTIADYLLALFLAGVFAFPIVLASTCGFILGAFVNYCGHTIFSYEHTSKDSISLVGFGKYLAAILVSLLVRVAVVALLGYFSALPFWFILLCAIGASFISSYVISTLWVFRKPD